MIANLNRYISNQQDNLYRVTRLHLSEYGVKDYNDKSLA